MPARLGGAALPRSFVCPTRTRSGEMFTRRGRRLDPAPRAGRSIVIDRGPNSRKSSPKESDARLTEPVDRSAGIGGCIDTGRRLGLAFGLIPTAFVGAGSHLSSWRFCAVKSFRTAANSALPVARFH